MRLFKSYPFYKVYLEDKIFKDDSLEFKITWQTITRDSSHFWKVAFDQVAHLEKMFRRKGHGVSVGQENVPDAPSFF